MPRASRGPAVNVIDAFGPFPELLAFGLSVCVKTATAVGRIDGPAFNVAIPSLPARARVLAQASDGDDRKAADEPVKRTQTRVIGASRDAP